MRSRVEAGVGRRDLPHPPVEFELESLRLLIGRLDLAHEAALTAPEPHPPVRLTQLVPRHRVHKSAWQPTQTTSRLLEPPRWAGEATEEAMQPWGVAAHGSTVAWIGARDHGQCTSHRVQAIR